jgi:ribosomal protein L21E
MAKFNTGDKVKISENPGCVWGNHVESGKVGSVIECVYNSQFDIWGYVVDGEINKLCDECELEFAE